MTESQETIPSQYEGEEAPAAQYAGFGVRLAALALDAILLNLLALALFVLGDWGNIQPEPLVVLTSLLHVAYFVGFWVRWGQTPGKMALRLKVVQADGSPLALSQAIIRYLLYGLAFFILDMGLSLWFLLPILALTYYSIATDRERRGLHDKLAGTRVVRVPREPRAA